MGAESVKKLGKGQYICGQKVFTKGVMKSKQIQISICFRHKTWLYEKFEVKSHNNPVDSFLHGCIFSNQERNQEKAKTGIRSGSHL